MTKLFFTQHRSSIWRIALFTVFLEFNVVNKCASNSEICITSNRRNISYFKVNINETTWFLAWQACINRRSILPVICNKNEQDALVKYLRGNIGSSEAWTSGKKIYFTDWTWIDGQPFNNTGMILPLPESSNTHVILDENRNYTAQNPRRRSVYLCQYSGSSCNSGNVINLTKGCVRPSDEERSWYDARNQCLMKGSDLAILTDADLVTLKESNMLQADRSYYVGLRKNTWLWMWQNTTVQTKDSGLEIKYSDWSNDPHSLTYGCISIAGWNSGWKAVACTDKKEVVCQASSNETTPSTSSIMTSSIPTRSSSTATSTGTMSSTMSSTKLSATTRSMSSVSESETQSSTNVDSQVLLYSGVCAGIVIIIITIIIILAVRRRRKRYKDMNRSKDKNNSGQNRLDLSPNKPATSPTTSPANAPANAPLTGSDDTLGVYAEISLATLNQREDETKTEQPGIVYASLEFQKEPTYLEPDKKRAYATDATK